MVNQNNPTPFDISRLRSKENLTTKFVYSLMQVFMHFDIYIFFIWRYYLLLLLPENEIKHLADETKCHEMYSKMMMKVWWTLFLECDMIDTYLWKKEHFLFASAHSHCSIKATHFGASKFDSWATLLVVQRH